MTYGYSKTLTLPFTQAIAHTKQAFAEAGFGALTEIDVQAKFKEKLGVDFNNYCILGMCSPQHAYKALSADPEIGLLLPCNVIVYEKAGDVIVSTILPTALFSIIDNPDIQPVAQEVESTLKGVIDTL